MPAILIDVLAAKGVRNIVCSPGSRNVPLLLAAAARNDMKKHFVVDERSAAFLALGLALVKQEPVALVCTSGTALLNYAPAVAEAYYQGVPLIVISADRPVQWIDQDDSQTLRQDNALANFVKNSYSIPVLDKENPEMKWYVNRIANDAVITAVSGKPGPVHINVHLAEPLNVPQPVPLEPQRVVTSMQGDAIINKEVIRQLARTVAGAKVMLVAGFCQPDAALQKAVADFARLPNVVVMAETISNLHLDPEAYSVDTVLTAFPAEELDALAPDIVISIGGALVSRKLKEYLRRNAGKCRHWFVGYSHTTSDPFMSLTLRIEVEPARFFRQLTRSTLNPKPYTLNSSWSRLRALAAQKHDAFLASCEWSELAAFDLILKNIPKNFNLFLSNGTAIRYAQIIRYRLPHASYCNRGVSGIDGSLSTAIGGAIAYKGPTLLITGDLSLAYDIGALGLPDIPDNFKIIVIDNQGGGIFRFIPSTASLDIREEYLCMPPSLPLAQLASAYHFTYSRLPRFSSQGGLSGPADATGRVPTAPSSLNSKPSTLNSAPTLSKWFSAPGKAIMHVVCPGHLSATLLRSFLSPLS